MTFNPNEHLSKLRGKAGDYLEVKWRLVWFRDLHPHGEVSTELIHFDLEKGIAIFKAVIIDGEGGIASGHGSETAKDFGDYLEKAETKAIGRALAALGYGTQFAPELEEGNRIVDAPVVRNAKPETVKNTLENSEPSPQQIKEIVRLANLLDKNVPRPTTYKEAQAMAVALAREYNAREAKAS